MQKCLYPLFQNQYPTSCCPRFSENYLNPQVRINKTVNKHTVITIFLWTPKGFIPSESLELSPKSVYFTMVVEKFLIYSAKTNANTFVSQKKIEYVQFYSCPQAKLSPRVLIIIPQANGNCPFHQSSIFRRYFFLSRKRGRGFM